MKLQKFEHGLDHLEALIIAPLISNWKAKKENICGFFTSGSSNHSKSNGKTLSLQHLPISIMGEVVGVYCIVDNIKKFQH
jgi:hypothetical protein